MTAQASSSAETTGSVRSADGTVIGYRRCGTGPAVVLLHGAMQSSSSFSMLAGLLAADFTVHVPDRRGRGLSGPAGEAYNLDRECEDLQALIEHSDTARVFGLSSGALIALSTAARYHSVRLLALYEPPLVTAGTRPDGWGPRYQRELDAGDLAAALVTVLKGTGDRGLFSALPRFLLVPLFRRALARHATPIGEVPLRDLIPTVRNDLTLPSSMPPIESFADLGADVLLLGGDRSNRYLMAALDALEAMLPDAERQEFWGVGHIAADNHGKPELVAASLRRFFSAPVPAALTP